MNRQVIFAIGLILIVSFESSLAQNSRANVTIGARRKGDYLVDSKTETFQFPNRQDVTKTVSYSTGKNGPRLTQVTFDVETNSNQQVTSRLVSGGEGQKNIEVALTAKAVTVFKYTVYVYGNSAALMPSLGLIATFIVYTIFTNKQ